MEKIKKPHGWWLKPVFVDTEGNVFHKGVEQPELKGTLPSTEEKAVEKEEKVEEVKNEIQKPKEQKMENTISQSEIEAIRKENAEIKELLKNMPKPQSQGGVGMSSMELAEAIATNFFISVIKSPPSVAIFTNPKTSSGKLSIVAYTLLNSSLSLS